jgi:hypothetical protein
MTDKAKIDDAINGDYTPGPWEARTSPLGECYVFARGRIFVDEVRPRTGMADADARLIAAAPDLAAEIKRLREALELFADVDNWNDGDEQTNWALYVFDGADNPWEIARAALAKTGGEHAV